MKVDKLIYKHGRHSQSAIKKTYLEWRKSNALPIRCDIQGCYFYNNPLLWNRAKLGLILDHINGVSGDNRPKNLRLLCPNCNSQQSTNGGRNKGKVVQSSGGFAIKRSSGKKDYVIPIEAGSYKLRSGSVKFSHKKLNS